MDMVNRYDEAAPIQYVSQYVPIPFQELVTLGKYYSNQRKQAEEELAESVKTFGKFVSPSAIDMENYNKETIGKLSPYLEQVAKNPAVMKDAAWRASLQSQLNSLDYTKLGMLEQSADNLRAGLEMRAKMEAEGLYNKDWDLSDIPNYDTLGSNAVFSDISPVKYMTANELSNKYFDNLKAGDLGTVWRDGVKYRAIGNSVKDLEAIYDTYENDLINSPQGKAYMRQFIAANNGDIESAREDFRSMILSSQMDRTIRPNLQVDQGWLLQEKARIARSVGTQEVNYTAPTRQQQIGGDVATEVIRKVGKLPVEVEKQQNAHILAAQAYNDAYVKAKARYDETGADEDLIYMNQMYSKAQQEIVSAQAYPIRHLMRDAFKKTANFDLYAEPKDNQRYNRTGYVAGAKSAVSAISNTVSLHSVDDGGDPLLTRVGGVPEKYTLKNGAHSNVYVFENSSGFVLPETLLQLMTDTQPAEPVRNLGLSNTSGFALRELLEGGKLSGIHFIPNTQDNVAQIAGTDNDSHKIINGKIRIPANQVRDMLGSGMAGGWAIPFMKTSATTMIEDQFNGRVVEYGEDGTEYFEIDGSYVLPGDSNDNYWYDINQLRENSPSAGGVGGASQAEQQRMATLQSLMLQ